MKYWLLITIFLLFESDVLVYAETNTEQSSNSNLQAGSNGKSEQIVKQKAEEKNHWPETFIPSEKIKADSSVPFPVDI